MNSNDEFEDRLSLQPLRIPQGWTITYNHGLYEIDPDPDRVPEDERWWVFKTDMLQMQCASEDVLVDVGWAPEGNLVDGVYRLQVYQGDFSGTCLHAFETNRRAVLVDELERVLDVVHRQGAKGLGG